jgi:hypothetical protein
MERLLKTSAPEQAIAVPASPSGLRTSFFAVLVIMVAAGAWVRFNDRIAAIVPALAGPAAAAADQAGVSTRLKALVELGLVPVSATAEAVAAMGLPAADAALLSEAVRRDRLRLVRVPLVDDSADQPTDAGAGRTVEVSSAGYTTLVRLTRQPTIVTLPVGPIGTIQFHTASPDGVAIGTFTLAGPMRLPFMSPRQTLSVGVVAQ